MILNTITLHNFMSYADASLNLTSVNVACLAGSNGAGKSALLDAITWALWESARASSDELIRLGQKEMWVELTFELEGRQYRVRRSRQRTPGKSGSRGLSKGTLDVQVKRDHARTLELAPASVGSAEEPSRSGSRSACLAPGHVEPIQNQHGLEANSNNGKSDYVSLTAASMRETQAKINDLLRMEHETFINSVYLRQGKADEFTTKPPAERKQVLGEILGLSYFDKLQEEARSQARFLKTRVELVEQSIGNLSEVEARAIACETEFKECKSEIARVEEVLDSFEKKLLEAQEQQQQLRLFRQQLADGQQRKSELERDLQRCVEQQADLNKKLDNYRKLLHESSEIEKASREFSQVKNKVEKLDDSLLLLNDLTNQRMAAQSEIASARSKFEVDLQHWQSKSEDLTKRQAHLQEATKDKEKTQSSYEKYRQLLADEADMAKNQESHIQLTARAEQLQSQITEHRIRLEAEIQQKSKSREEYDSLLNSSELVEVEKSKLDEEARELDRLEAEFQKIEETGLKVKGDLEARQGQVKDLQRRQVDNQQKITELQEHCDSSLCPLCSAPIVDRAAVIARYEQQNSSLQSEIDQLKDSIAKLEDERASLRRQYLEMRTRLDGRKALDTKIGQFNEKLSALQKARSGLEELTSELKLLSQRLDAQDYAHVERTSLINVKTELHKLDFDNVIFSNLQGQIRSQRYTESRFHQLQKDLQELSKLDEAKRESGEKIQELQILLNGDDYAHEQRAAAVALQQKIDALAYDRQEHQELRQRLSELLPQSDLYRDLESARGELPSLEQALQTCNDTTEEKRRQLLELDADLKLWVSELDKSAEIEAYLSELQPTVTSYRDLKQEKHSQLAVIEARQQDLKEKTIELQEKRKELERLNTEVDDYLYLSEAFGKKGIQAVIIENAIPEIESEANRILSRLSDNQMHVALATQYKTKSGSIVETLDLLIGDEIGTRSYELYSGGEAFKVDFAVRVALSRLLARRSGAKLETLIIDEGFGSQDEVSRDRMIKAINSIRMDFARILVVTHINEVKEMFPTHIHVTKVGGTSQVHIVG